MSEKELSIDDLASFCKKKGFVFPSGEIYGGLAGFWDFGHLGVEMIRNLKRDWWNTHVRHREDVVGLDGAIITNPKVWEASGHVGGFVDVAVQCKKCKDKSKVDKHELGKVKCGKCGGEYEDKGEFNPMFSTEVGVIKEEASKAYLRPETAQLMFANFKNVVDTARMRLPFGIAQIGKVFRNEVSPREFLFRSREFEQMEIEYFIKKGMKCPYVDEICNLGILVYSEDMQKSGKEPKKMKILEALKKGILKRDWHAYWIGQKYSWFLSLGANPKKFRIRQHTKEELSHYSSDTWDLEYEFPMGWRELMGFADRSDYDLSQHEKFSKKKLAMDDPNHGKVLPEVVCEPSLGVGRAFLVFMLDAYRYDKKRDNIVLSLDPKLAPIKAAVFPLVSKGEVFEVAKEVYRDLLEDFNVFFDSSGSIGRRYARQDEGGTPFCITVDQQSLEDKKVTIRERDSMKQIRVDACKIRELIGKLVTDDIGFSEAGEAVK